MKQFETQEARESAIAATRESMHEMEKNLTGKLDEIKNLAVMALAICESSEDLDEKAEFEEYLEKLVNFYTSETKLACYKQAKASENPMHYAVTEFAYPTIRVKETKDKETKVSIREVVDAEKQIDLLDLHKWMAGNKPASGGIGANTDWVYAADKLNLKMAKDAASDLNNETVKNRLSDASQLSLKKESAEFKLSNNEAKKALQEVITMMLGEGYAIKAYDYKGYLHRVYITDNKKAKLGVKMADRRSFATYLKKICYRILSGAEQYEPETKLLKKEG